MMFRIRMMKRSKVFVMLQDGLLVFELQIDGQHEMDVLLVAGVHAAAGNMKRKKPVGRKPELFQENQLQGFLCVIKGNGKVGQSEHKTPLVNS
jgi:hypothetical protein